MNITLTINGRDFHARVATYHVNHLREELRTVVTLDGAEHTADRRRTEVTFSLAPFREGTGNADYLALNGLPANVTYTDPLIGTDVTRVMRCVSDLEGIFGLRGPDNNRYYKGGDIVLRAVSAG